MCSWSAVVARQKQSNANIDTKSRLIVAINKINWLVWPLAIVPSCLQCTMCVGWCWTNWQVLVVCVWFDLIMLSALAINESIDSRIGIIYGHIWLTLETASISPVPILPENLLFYCHCHSRANRKWKITDGQVRCEGRSFCMPHCEPNW